MHEQLWDQLKDLDPCQTAARALCEHCEDSGCYRVRMLENTYIVDPSERSIYAEPLTSESQSAGFLEQLCVLVYLASAKDLPLADKLVKGESFPGGMFFFRGQHALPTQKLLDAFGAKPDLLYEASKGLPFERSSFGDASVRITVLPRVPVTLIVWGGDEEFEASASILFDATAGEHLPLDALLAAVNLAIDAVLHNVGPAV